MKAIIIKADEWEGLYVNGRLVHEDYEISRKILQRLCKTFDLNFIDIEEEWVTADYENHLENVGNLPENLAEVDYIK